MGTLAKQTYDPHLLYHAINITVELEYKIPMQKVYDILALIDKTNKQAINKIQPSDVLNVLKKLGTSIENADVDDKPSDATSLQEKIKELLRLLGCELSDCELNKILKGELSLDEVLSKDAKTAWLIIFDKGEDGKMRPVRELVDHMTMCSHIIALENIEQKIQRNMERYTINKRNGPDRTIPMYGNMKVLHKKEKELNDPVLLEKKRNKLRLYIAHMQGYDRDRDRDGGRGVDMTTGYVIDFGDIYIADKYSNVIEDIGRDGIDLCDLH